MDVRCVSNVVRFGQELAVALLYEVAADGKTQEQTDLQVTRSALSWKCLSVRKAPSPRVASFERGCPSVFMLAAIRRFPTG